MYVCRRRRRPVRVGLSPVIDIVVVTEEPDGFDGGVEMRGGGEDVDGGGGDADGGLGDGGGVGGDGYAHTLLNVAAGHTPQLTVIPDADNAAVAAVHELAVQALQDEKLTLLPEPDDVTIWPVEQPELGWNIIRGVLGFRGFLGF